ncbi:CoA ester lyase [Aeromicrobium alkaliterrae]|uniref:CoA ester lyase n=1 Tax=Aeromicrobium alkaliterrae TaxID=302168 RepID=A0ABN2K9I7_9ACTN
MSNTTSPTPPGRTSILCVPAANPTLVQKALTTSASEVVLDLEDAVAPERKDVAREVVRGLKPADGGPRVTVRINQLRSPWGLRDLRAVAESGAGVASIVVPKVESREDLAVVETVLEGIAAELGRAVPLRVQALVETARGVANLDDICSRRDRLDGLVVGYADLTASLGRHPDADPSTWTPIQMEVLIRARAANLDVVDGPHLAVDVDEPFTTAVERAVTLGFDAKWVIHPRQIEHVNDAFTPSASAVAHAERVVEMLGRAHEGGSGALALDGELVDEAMAVAARRVLAKAAR